MAAPQCADTMHDPGGETVSPGSLPLSIQLEGERDNKASQYVELMDVKPTDIEMNAKVDNNELKLPRDPVVTQDSDKHCPNESTEPPDEEEGAQGGNDKVKVKLRIEEVKSSQVNKLRSKGDEGEDRVELTEVKGEKGGQNNEDGSH
ncbi:hypothetical protein BDN67DRAFT_1015911 [Paxillus ammoniavirescens]|nr:hypothetical protein BDN67DRAFT_1015911 [Paxillus ammoniavirescens]